MESVRMCVGCRTRAPRSSLIRVTAGPERLLVDRSARLPGRGAWLHPDPGCVETALARRALDRALRAAGRSSDDVAELAAQLAAQTANDQQKADRNMDNS